jgi:hypothetical protein
LVDQFTITLRKTWMIGAQILIQVLENIKSENDWLIELS